MRVLAGAGVDYLQITTVYVQIERVSVLLETFSSFIAYTLNFKEKEKRVIILRVTKIRTKTLIFCFIF